MSINFAAISPHPPIIVPEVGKEELETVSQTVQAMKKMAYSFREAEIDTLIIISPHMLTYQDRFNLCGMKKLFGSFASFGAPDKMIELTNDLNLAQEIEKSAQNAGIQTILYNNDGEFFELDHGLMVPLCYLCTDQEASFKVLPIAYSNLSRALHFSFGQIIGERVKKYPQRVGIIASGDLSHRLSHGVKSEIEEAKAFDRKITADLKNRKTQDILYYEEEFVEQAGECGYRSILILLGALAKNNPQMEILSYEGPLGVGYLVGLYRINE